VRLERATGVPDAHGAIRQSWSLLEERWAAIEPLTGRELLDARQVQARASTQVRLRDAPDLRPKDRIVWTVGGRRRVFHIQAVVDRDERSRETLVTCEELADAS
jgi:SPP1 family predicted phage head-tail adaptor